jgi:hypothetical protein
VCSLDRCENVTVCCASTVLRIGNCVDCTVYSFTSSTPPVVFGDTRSLVLAPHNASYPELVNKLKEAGIVIKPGDDKTGNFSKPTLMKVSKQSTSLQQPTEYMKMSLPKKFGDAQLFLCPQEFVKMMELRAGKFAEIQNKIKEAKLTHEQEKMLHVAI